MGQSLRDAAQNFLDTLDEYWRVLGKPSSDSSDEEAAYRDLERSRQKLKQAIEEDSDDDHNQTD